MKPYDARLTAFTPKLVTVLGEGYTFDRLRRDSIAGLTVAIVALPLAMALAIASGATPDKGLITAVIAGFLISALGGSRVQVGGDRKSKRLNSSHYCATRMPSSA